MFWREILLSCEEQSCSFSQLVSHFEQVLATRLRTSWSALSSAFDFVFELSPHENVGAKELLDHSREVSERQCREIYPSCIALELEEKSSKVRWVLRSAFLKTINYFLKSTRSVKLNELTSLSVFWIWFSGVDQRNQTRDILFQPQLFPYLPGRTHHPRKHPISFREVL